MGTKKGEKKNQTEGQGRKMGRKRESGEEEEKYININTSCTDLKDHSIISEETGEKEQGREKIVSEDERDRNYFKRTSIKSGPYTKEKK